MLILDPGGVSRLAERSPRPVNVSVRSDTPMSRWLVKLEGDRIDLEEFPYWFPSGDVFALAEGDSVFIAGPALERLDGPSEVLEAATQALDEFSAIIALLWASLQRPSVGNVYREDETGTRKSYAFASFHASGRSKVRARSTLTVSGGSPVSRGPTQAQQLLAASRRSTNLQVATLLWADPLRTWPRLYRVMEELEEHLQMTVNKAKLCSDNQRERFRRSANTAEVAGKDSRHASGKLQPPTKPMSLSEATTFVGVLLEATLRCVDAEALG